MGSWLCLRSESGHSTDGGNKQGGPHPRGSFHIFRVGGVTAPLFHTLCKAQPFPPGAGQSPGWPGFSCLPTPAPGAPFTQDPSPPTSVPYLYYDLADVVKEKVPKR